MGEQESEAHLGVGAVAGRNVDRLYLMGKLMTRYTAESAIRVEMPAESVVCCQSHGEIAEHLYRSLAAGDVILFKGSRGMAMEKAAVELKRLIKGE